LPRTPPHRPRRRDHEGRRQARREARDGRRRHQGHRRADRQGRSQETEAGWRTKLPMPTAVKFDANKQYLVHM
jgi:hypothetical protein